MAGLWKECCIHAGRPQGRQSACTAGCNRVSSARTQCQMLRASHIWVPSALGSCSQTIPRPLEAGIVTFTPLEVGPLQEATGDSGSTLDQECWPCGIWGRVLGLSHPQASVWKGNPYGNKNLKPATEVKSQTLGECLITFEPHNVPASQTRKIFLF